MTNVHYQTNVFSQDDNFQRSEIMNEMKTQLFKISADFL